MKAKYRLEYAPCETCCWVIAVKYKWWPWWLELYSSVREEWVMEKMRNHIKKDCKKRIVQVFDENGQWVDDD